MINIFKKYLWRKIHELNTLIRSSNDSKYKYIVKKYLLQNTYWQLLLLFRKVLQAKFPLFSEINSYPHIFSHLKIFPFLWKGPLAVKVTTKKIIDQALGYINFYFEIRVHQGHLFR